MKLGIRELLFFVVMIGLVVACGSLFNKSRLKRDWYLTDTASKRESMGLDENRPDRRSKDLPRPRRDRGCAGHWFGSRSPTFE